MVDPTTATPDSYDGGAMTTCVCRDGFDPRRFMLECAYCEHWFHGVCVQLSEEKAFAIAKFACPACTNKGCQTKYVSDPKPPLDASLLPLPRQFAALNIKQVLSDPTPTSVDKASAKMHQMLECGMFARSGVRRIPATAVTAAYIRTNGFAEPIVADDSLGALPGLHVPESSIHVDDVPNILAAAKVIKTIDVSTQVPRQVSYTDVLSICNGGDSWTGNVEFSVVDTSLEFQITPPQLVADLDWFHHRSQTNAFNPNTYLSMYSVHSFKDFSMNPNGSSAWLHHLYGPPLTLFLVPPTPAHLEKFVEWSVSPARATVHFGDLVDKCIKVDVPPNTTVFVPASWIYSVFVPSVSSATAAKPETVAPETTTAVFVTAYFFHGFSMKEQVKVLEVEQTIARKATATGRPPMWPMVTSAAQFPAPSPEMLKTWVWPAVQRYIGRLRSLQVLSEWETQGLLHILPLLRHCDVPNQGDSSIDALQSLLGVKDPHAAVVPSNSSVATAMPSLATSKVKVKKAMAAAPPTPMPPHVATTASLLSASDSFLKQRDRKVCKCHLKKCVNCRNCTKRHCICGTSVTTPSHGSAMTGTLGNPMAKKPTTAAFLPGDKKPKKKPLNGTPLSAQATTAGSQQRSTTSQQLGLHHSDLSQALPPSGVLAPWTTDDDDDSLRQDATSSMWDHDMNQSFFSATELGLNMTGTLELDDAFGIIDMVESSSLFSGYPSNDGVKACLSNAAGAAVATTATTATSSATKVKEEAAAAPTSVASIAAPPPPLQLSALSSVGGGSVQHSFLYDPAAATDTYNYDSEKEGIKDFGDLTPDADGSQRHRASCHRCGNLRKKNVRCLGCPHIFCQKCAEKMVEEHGAQTFIGGCPVCKELCCCGKNRSTVCRRKFHCYKKCPATKRCNLNSDDQVKLRGDDAEVFKDDDMLMEFAMHDDDLGDLDGNHIMTMPPSLADTPDALLQHALSVAPPHPSRLASSSLSECDFDMELGDLE
ncbi:hypothetical protein H310_04161 [Aphanomyces invadans]|uniref:JmjC domain-containing protein n=1 Tax=Aphanomyces invadans TaxID=157072 RepID=A0A024UFU5_9STRA|nr:hypothetical protein H310_04161 [Aphanomyces invadans]ETW05154.1 hypothetical protein H310_04161 [Aphanomyces invadans]|eukprot:XP_008866593.1 hypothetical protein H310_04161 [Aphanomyces invadans]